MEYSVRNLFGFQHDDPITIRSVIEKFYSSYDLVLKCFEDDLKTFKAENQTYTFPISNEQLAKKIKLLTIGGFLVINEITNDVQVASLLQSIIDNQKVVTPDLFFYVVILLNEILEKSYQNSWNSNFVNIIERIEFINFEWANSFTVDLFSLANLKITNDDLNLLNESLI